MNEHPDTAIRALVLNGRFSTGIRVKSGESAHPGNAMRRTMVASRLAAMPGKSAAYAPTGGSTRAGDDTWTIDS